MQLERNQIQSWMDLARAFLKQYDYNLDIAPYRMHLQELSQEINEPIRKYAQRWREFAARVHPPLLDQELTSMFVDSLQDPYFERLLGLPSSFSDVVALGERLEYAIRIGKIQITSNDQAGETEYPCDYQSEEGVVINAVMPKVEYPRS